MPPGRGSPPENRDDDLEVEILARDPDLVPLGVRVSPAGSFGWQFLCYRLTELAAGRATVVSLPYDVAPDSPVTWRADSLLAALHVHHTENAEAEAAERRRTMGHSGSNVDDSDVATAWEFVACVEDLIRRLA